MKISAKAAVAAAASFCLAAAALYKGNKSITVSNFAVKSAKIPLSFDGFRIVQLSDLHCARFGKGNSALLKKIGGQNPDVVVMTGDMVSDGDKKYSAFLSLAESLASKYKCYYIVGNHEQGMKKGRVDFLLHSLDRRGITVLNNKKTEIIKGASGIDLYGMWIGLKYYKGSGDYSGNIDFTGAAMSRLMGDNDERNFSVLLTHNPLYFDIYAGWGADLTLSGHVHGGVIRLPGIGGLLSPERTFFPKYSAGKYNIGEKSLIVNRGLGGNPPVVRVNDPPEITVVTLKSENERPLAELAYASSFGDEQP